MVRSEWHQPRSTLAVIGITLFVLLALAGAASFMGDETSEAFTIEVPMEGRYSWTTEGRLANGEDVTLFWDASEAVIQTRPFGGICHCVTMTELEDGEAGFAYFFEPMSRELVSMRSVGSSSTAFGATLQPNMGGGVFPWYWGFFFGGMPLSTGDKGTVETRDWTYGWQVLDASVNHLELRIQSNWFRYDETDQPAIDPNVSVDWEASHVADVLHFSKDSGLVPHRVENERAGERVPSRSFVTWEETDKFPNIDARAPIPTSCDGCPMVGPTASLLGANRLPFGSDEALAEAKRLDVRVRSFLERDTAPVVQSARFTVSGGGSCELELIVGCESVVHTWWFRAVEPMDRTSLEFEVSRSEAGVRTDGVTEGTTGFHLGPDLIPDRLYTFDHAVAQLKAAVPDVRIESVRFTPLRAAEYWGAPGQVMLLLEDPGDLTGLYAETYFWEFFAASEDMEAGDTFHYSAVNGQWMRTGKFYADALAEQE